MHQAAGVVGLRVHRAAGVVGGAPGGGGCGQRALTARGRVYTAAPRSGFLRANQIWLFFLGKEARRSSGEKHPVGHGLWITFIHLFGSRNW